ncbi:MAG: ATP-binding cassette domain-containing protein [Bacteroidota bacterium]
MIRLSNFKKYYQHKLVLAIPELVFTEGTHWVTGINGSGKTSLFKSMAGMLPFRGEIVLDSKINIKKHPIAFRKLVNFSEAEPKLPGFLSGQDLINFIAKAKRSTTAQQDQLIDLFAINSFIDQPLKTYSSGMLKKISLVMAFLGSPRVILLDEPFTTIDQQTKIKLYELIEWEKAENGVLFLLSSHQGIEEEHMHIDHFYHVADGGIKVLEAH